MPTRRQFVQVTAAAGAASLLSARGVPGAEPGFRGTLCFFSKHLPNMDAPRLGRTLKTLGFAGVDLTVRPGGHIDPTRVAQDLPPFVAGIRKEGLTVPMITTEILSDADPVARPTLETAASLGVPYFKPGYYRYAFVDARKERDAAAEKIRTVAALSARTGVHMGFHNHSGYIGGNIWDVVEVIDSLDPKWAGYYFDVRHAVVEGGDGGWRTAFNLAAKRLPMIALKDFYWEKAAAGWRIKNCPMGEGMVNWKAYFALLAKANFHGPVSLHLEYEIPGGTPAAVETNTIAAAAKDLAFIKAGLAEAYV
jgi:sugar phosphate isomerase/epimerase